MKCSVARSALAQVRRQRRPGDPQAGHLAARRVAEARDDGEADGGPPAGLRSSTGIGLKVSSSMQKLPSGQTLEVSVAREHRGGDMYLSTRDVSGPFNQITWARRHQPGCPRGR
jgi:hypothetical protein